MQREDDDGIRLIWHFTATFGGKMAFPEKSFRSPKHPSPEERNYKASHSTILKYEHLEKTLCFIGKFSYFMPYSE